MNQVIGIDFDNTLISYDNAMKQVALRLGLVDGDAETSKKTLRNSIRLLPSGELRWQELQAQVYGPEIGQATLNEGVLEFISACRSRQTPVFVISHKTEFAKADANGTNLRSAAIAWMTSHNFFNNDGLGLSHEQVYFENSRQAKLQRIKSLKCTHFVDDLEETFLEESFPPGVIKILYSPHQTSSLPTDVNVASTWSEIAGHVWGLSLEAARK